VSTVILEIVRVVAGSRNHARSRAPALDACRRARSQSRHAAYDTHAYTRKRASAVSARLRAERMLLNNGCHGERCRQHPRHLISMGRGPSPSPLPPPRPSISPSRKREQRERKRLLDLARTRKGNCCSTFQRFTTSSSSS